jgi:ABC-type transport system involved in multi-copper enzyme maturation permease subunit
MTELTKKEIGEGKKVLGGVLILLWVAGVITWLGLMSFNLFSWIPGWIPGVNMAGKFTDSSDILSIAIPAVYVAALIGLYIRKGWAVPVTRAAIVVTMVIFFPVGTIFGAIVWKRINDPVAKRYLNYDMKSDESDENNTGTDLAKEDEKSQLNKEDENQINKDDKIQANENDKTQS